MTVEFIKAPTQVVIKVPLHVAQMVRTSMGKMITCELTKEEQDEHYALFTALGAEGSGDYWVKQNERGLYLVRR